MVVAFAICSVQQSPLNGRVHLRRWVGTNQKVGHATLELPLAPDAALWAPRIEALLKAVREAVITPPSKEFTHVHLFGNHRSQQ